MRILIPDTPVTLASTNVTASSLDEWSNASVAYVVGDQVKLSQSASDVRWHQHAAHSSR